MTDRKARGLAWIMAVGMTSVLFVCAFVFLDMSYAVNDDASMLHAFQGYMNGKPATFLSFMHGLLVWPLHWLGSFAPQVAWYSYMQLLLLAVSCVVIAKSIMQIFVRRGAGLWVGAVMAAAVLGCLCLRYVTRITFTHTAALLGGAAVLQMLSIEHENPKKVIAGMMGSLALVALSYALRQEGVLPVLAVCGLVFVYLFVERYGFGKKAMRNARPMMATVLAVALVMGGMVGWRELEIELGGHRDYMEWQEVRSALMDFRDDLGALPQEAIDAAGWSPATFEMFKEWSFMDASITADSFQRALDMVESMDTRTFGERLADAWKLFASSVRSNRSDMRCMALVLIVLGLCLAGALINRNMRAFWMALALGGLLVAMLAYLALQGRLPARAMLMAALPVGAALIGLLPVCLPGWQGTLAAFLCAAYAVNCVLAITPELLKNEERDAELGNAMRDLEEYALWEPDSLFVLDQTLSGADSRLFPEYPDGVPDNITFWGGWLWRSPQSREQWDRFGVDVENFDPAVFVEQDIYIAAGRIDPQPELVLNWLREKLGDDVQCEYWGENGTVYFFYFHQ